MIEFKLRSIDRLLELGIFLILVFSFAVLAYFIGELPEEVRIYFNKPSGKDFALKSELWKVPITSTILVIVLLFLARQLSSNSKAKGVQVRSRISASMMRILALLISLFGLTLLGASIANGLGNRTDFESYFTKVLPLVLVGGMLFHLVLLILNRLKEGKESQ